MTRFYLLWSFLVSSSLFAADQNTPSINQTLRERYPHSLLTPDYGIVTEFDLADDARTYRMAPYDPQTSRQAYWRCVPTKEVSSLYETWRDSDPLGSKDSIITLCSLYTMVKSKDAWHLYHGRRAQPVEFCREYIKKWKALTKDEPVVCLSGDATGVETKKVKGVSRRIYSWVWNKFRTPKGCHSYFDNCKPYSTP